MSNFKPIQPGVNQTSFLGGVMKSVLNTKFFTPPED